MPEYLVIRLRDEDDGVEWVQADGNGTLLSRLSTGTLAEAAADAGERSVIGLVPATDVLTTTIHMPIRSVSKLRTALPFALEENLADDVGDLHFAIGERRENNRIPVAVVADGRMSGWLERFREVGLEPAVLTAENQGLAGIPGTMSMLVDGATVMFNDGAESEFVMQDVKPSDVLVVAGRLGDERKDAQEEEDREDAQEEEDREEAAHLLVFCTAGKEQELTHDWIALRHELHSVDVNVLPDGVMPKLAVTVAAGHGVNLLQEATAGKPSTRASSSRGKRRRCCC